jgi:tetratricopeptide (TPR) repeat protein
MRLLKWLGPMALSLAMGAGPTLAQDWKGMGRFEGRVVDSDGKPIVGATVNVTLPSRGGAMTVKTDKKGRWVVGGVAAGVWNVDVEAEGYAPKKGEFNLTSEGARVQPLEIKLEKAGPAAPPPELLAAVQKGDEAYKAGRWAEARAEYEKVLALRGDLAAQLHELIARTYSQEENYAKSVEHLEHVLQAQPDNANLRVLVAQEALRGGMLEKGLGLLKSLDERAITNPEIFYNVGVILRNQPDAAGDDAKMAMAVEYFSKAVALDPSLVDGYMQRGLTQLSRGKSAEAKADFQKVVELAPTSAQAELAKKALGTIK